MGSIITSVELRMGWLTACLFGMLLVSVRSMPLEEEIEDQDEVREIFTRLFIDGRTGRDLEMEIDNTIEDEEEESESKAIEGAIQETNTQEISRFNNYIDAIYKRMNAALRAKLMDPMVLNLQGKDKKEGSEKKTKDAKKRVERDVQESSDNAKGDEEEDSDKDMDDEIESEVEIDHRAGEPKTKQKGNKKEKKEKREKHKNKNKKVKDKTKKKEKKNKEGKEEKKSATKQKRQENKLKAKKEREQAKKEKEDAKAAKKLAKAAKADKKAAKAAKKEKDQARESRSREHGQHHNKKKGAKAPAKGRNGAKKEKNGMKKDKKNNNKKDKDQKKQKGSKGSKASKGKARNNKEVSKESKVMGSLAGIATLRRSGDVSVIDDENHKVVTSSFTVGPLQLEVSKTLGQGKSRTVRTAKATTDVMTGTMVLKVKPDGSAHVKKVVFAKPDHVDVKGSLSDNKPRSITYLKNSVNRMRPMAAQKILKTARYVLKAPATVKQ